MNKPVAWMQVHHKDNKPTKFSLVQTWEDDIPLYTHPVKKLTDKEINLLAKAYSTMEGELNAPAFAKAILRKAQEK